MERVGFLFAGQGSQYVGMGKDLYASFPESKRVFDQADDALGFSLSRLCFEGPEEELTKTHTCQPAILTVSIAAWEAFKAVCQVCCPESDDAAFYSGSNFAAGLSLGEYSALVAAQVLTFSDAVQVVRKRGTFMEEAAARKPGTMLSVIGLDRETVAKIARDSNTEIANLNCPGQIVLSGGVAEIPKAADLAKDAGARMTVPLQVSGAFHSSFMREAGERLAQELASVTIKQPEMPVVANVTAQVSADPDEIRANLCRQVSGSVLWEDSMNLLLSKGIRQFYEFGPGKVLKGLMRRIDKEVQVVVMEKAPDIHNCGGGDAS